MTSHTGLDLALASADDGMGELDTMVMKQLLGQGPHEDDAERARVREVLNAELEQVQTPEQAEEIVRRVEQLAAGETTGKVTDAAATATDVAPPAATVEQAAETGPPSTAVAASLATAAAQGLAPTPAAPAVAVGAADALGVKGVAAPARSEQAGLGRRLLREAMLRHMGPVQALDARLFLTVNQLPHAPWSNKLADAITVSTTGGWIWVLGLLGARALGVGGTEGALRCVAPAVLGATMIVEYPIKKTFRRRRPFIDVVRALVIGRRPDGWSFPSGHTAAAFSGALMLSHVWPARAPIFFLAAGTVGFSRVYVGAHYPGDVMSGATLGLTLAETIRQAIRRLGR